MARGHHPTEDLDVLIDQAVDTFCVEESELDPAVLKGDDSGSNPASKEAAGKAGKTSQGVSLDSALDEMFSTPLEEDPPPHHSPAGGAATPTSLISSGDPETDRAIDFAVETLFVEIADIAPGSPETTEIEVSDVVAALDDSASEPIDEGAPTIDLDIADDIQIEAEGSGRSRSTGGFRLGRNNGSL